MDILIQVLLLAAGLIIWLGNFDLPFFVQFIVLVLGFVLLVKGADSFVDGAAGIAKKFGIPELIIGLTIVAMGTSAPETAVSLAAALKGNADISIGNVVGSNIMNVLVILGIASVIIPIAVGKSTLKYEMPFVILISGLFFILGMDGTVSRLDGVVLWACFIVYLVYLFIMARKNKDESVSEILSMPLWKALIYTALGLGMIVAGSNCAVDSASVIAVEFGMSDRLIGLTVVALGTSLPELCTSVAAAKKGSADIAIGNIVGSNIFNILFVIGTSSLVIPIAYDAAFFVDSIVMIVTVCALWFLCFFTKKLERWGGAILLFGYAGYFAYLLMK